MNKLPGLAPAFLLLILTMALSSCATASTGFATSNIPLEGKRLIPKGEAEESVAWYSFDIAIISFPFSHPPAREALDALIKQKEGDAVINLRYSTDMVRILFITRHRLRLTGDVVSLEENRGPAKK